MLFWTMKEPEKIFSTIFAFLIAKECTLQISSYVKYATRFLYESIDLNGKNIIIVEWLNGVHVMLITNLNIILFLVDDLLHFFKKL